MWRDVKTSNGRGRVTESAADLISRRKLLRMGLAGFAGLTLPDLLRFRAEAVEQAGRDLSRKSVILLWMAGGPSQIDTWDLKPNRPSENRGPFATAATCVPGISVCEHLPKQAAMMDRFTLIRSVDSGWVALSVLGATGFASVFLDATFGYEHWQSQWHTLPVPPSRPARCDLPGHTRPPHQHRRRQRRANPRTALKRDRQHDRVFGSVTHNPISHPTASAHHPAYALP